METGNQHMNPSDAIKHKKLQQFELNLAKRRSFFKGVGIGIVVFFVIFLLLINFAYLNRYTIASKALNLVASNFLEEIFSSFPDGYITHNRERVIGTLDKFTNAASAKRITKEEFRRIGAKTVQAISDRKLTYQEITEILTMMDDVSH